MNKWLIILAFAALHGWLAFVNLRLLAAEKHLAYLEGRESIYKEWTEMPSSPSGTCFTKKGKC